MHLKTSSANYRHLVKGSVLAFIAATHTETEISSFCQNFHHWLQRKLSKWQLAVQLMKKIWSKWHFLFNKNILDTMWLIGETTQWWRNRMKTFSVLLAICAGNSPVPGEFPAQRPVTRSFDVFFDLHPNKQLSKQSWGWWFETPSRPLWRHCSALAFRDP